MRTISRLAALAVCAPAAFAIPAESERTYALSGQILVYPESVTGFAGELRLAPVGAQTRDEHLLQIETLAGIVLERGSVQSLSSGRIAPASAGLAVARGSDLAIDMGVPELHVEDGAWTLYGTSEEMYARPILAIAPQSLTVRRLSEIELSISGELVVHEAFAEGMNVPHLAGRPAGSLVLVARTSRGAASAVPIASILRAPPASAQPTQMNLVGTGPDVIVSTVGGGLASYGPVGNITAYAMTTVACNIGTGSAIWVASNNQHPVIGQNIYRLKTVNGAKQFDQIGMSWLKHAWCAADAPSCPGGTYAGHSGCDWLGLFATDTYGTSLNADQIDLGPRSEVNAWTGVYQYPYGRNWNTTGNAIFKRTQVQHSDLDPAQNAGAQYFGEVQYIATDEPDYHRYNNASWRPITSSGADGRTLTFSTATVPMEPAIRAWALNDAGVQLTDVDVPNDGRFILGSKATAIAGGRWHYEYVLYNMNVYDSAYSFSVPVAAIVNPNNVGFHDVPYHSGEPYDGTDWASLAAGGSLTWSTSSQPVDANANALRWGSSYSFRFDADSPPVAGTATIGLFSTLGTVTGAVVVPNDPGAAYCFGDGSGLACPCANSGAPGNGCANSLIATGANLAISGFASLSADSMTLVGTGMPNAAALYFQGTTALSAGQGQAFGDGLRCAGGIVRRLRTKTNVGNASQYPGIGDPPVHTSGAITGPGTRYYQVWYRNANPTFCTPLTYNLSNGYQLNWTP